MVWEQLSINKPHLCYIILGGFTTLFMLCSSVIKERLYIGEATVATVCGIIFGPHAANLIDPGTWGNTDQITLEFSRIVLVVQCFAVGVELPKYYMERHWRSVVFLLVPVMTFGWLVTSLFIWAMFSNVLNWLDSLVIAACVTATDPVLASSVVGKGKFAKRVPKHLRDLLSAESGCNDGMAFPFVYLGLYLVRYRPDANTVALHWFCNTILYECIWGATYGVIVGYLARRAIRYAHERDLIDRESFLVFYFVLALFCAGSGALLGMDDLLIGFACGVGFSNDGWFLEKTEEAHVSNVIDLLLNLAFFVYFGTIIPWGQYNAEVIGTTPWKLVVIALLVVFFRRIPIMLALKTFIPDVKTWREALFAGHFGPIGVGALFVAILARAELETETTTPLADLPVPGQSGSEHLNIIELIWPITTFLVITSIIVHGSSIAVFTLGKHINTLTITMSYTQATDQGNWMDRIPRIQSRSKSKGLDTDSDLEEKMPEYPAAVLPRNFLRRQKEEDNPSRTPSTSSRRRKRHWDAGMGPGGPIEQSAIGPQARPSRSVESSSPEKSFSGSTAAPTPTNENEDSKRLSRASGDEPEIEVYEEGNDTVIEDEQGNVLEVMHSPEGQREEDRDQNIENEIERLMNDEDVQHGESQKQSKDPWANAKEQVEEGVEAAEAKVDGAAPAKSSGKGNVLQRFASWRGEQQQNKVKSSKTAMGLPQRRHGPARAFKFGNTIIVEDEDGEVIKKYDIPQSGDRKQSYVDPERTRQRLQKMGKWMGMNQEETEAATSSSQAERPTKSRKESTVAEDRDDEQIRFTVEGNTRRMSKADFIRQLQALDPKSRAEAAEDSDAPDAVKKLARVDARENDRNARRATEVKSEAVGRDGKAELRKVHSKNARNAGPDGLTVVDEDEAKIPVHNFSKDLRKFSAVQETAAEKRRRAANRQKDDDSDDNGTERALPARRGRAASSRGAEESSSQNPRPGKGKERVTAGGNDDDDDDQETAAEKRRREAALGVSGVGDDSSEEENESRERSKVQQQEKPRGIKFADQTHPAKEGERSSAFGSIRWAQ